MATPHNDHTISLLLGGKQHHDWVSYSLDADLSLAADAWQLTLAPGSGRLPPEVAPGAEVKLLLGVDTVLCGRVDDVNHQVSAGSHQLTLSGRDLAGMLLDCSAPLLSAKGMTLADVLEIVVKPLGITRVRVDARAGSQIEKISVDPGSSAWDVLARAAEANGLAPWLEPDGTLVVGAPDYSVPVGATLTLRHDGRGNNVLELCETRSHAARHSQLTLLGQGHRQALAPGRHDLRHQAHDAGVAYFKPRIVTEADAANLGELAARADKLLADARLAGYTLTATVAGHRDSHGRAWQPGQRIHVISEPHGVDDVFFLMARTFSGGRGQGRRTRLTLKQDRCWLPTAGPQAKGA